MKYLICISRLGVVSVFPGSSLDSKAAYELKAFYVLNLRNLKFIFKNNNKGHLGGSASYAYA